MAEKNQSMSMSKLITIFLGVLAIFILFDPGLRSGMGAAVGFVFEPVVGFGGRFPIVTLFVAGMIMTSVTITVRHFFTDYVEQIKSQKVVSAFNKELREARKNNNTYKIKKLTDQQQDIMKKSMSVSTSQLKLLPVTMIVVIPIFAWLSVFMGDIHSPTVAVPWAMNASLNANYLLPAWILLYSLISIPFGQILLRSLRFYSFKKRLEEMESEKQSEEQPEAQ